MKFTQSSLENSRHQQRLDRLQKALHHQARGLCLIENPIDLLYFTGLHLSAGCLIVHSIGAQLFVDKRYIQSAQQLIGVEAAVEGEGAFEQFLHQHHGKQVVFDPHFTSYQRFITLEEKTTRQGCFLVADACLFKRFRAVKDKTEIVQLQTSAALLVQGFNHIRSLLKYGVTEKELKIAFEIFCLQRGASRLSFEPIIAFGLNSAMPHYRAGDAVLKEGDHVQIDIGVVVDSYHSDMSRVLFCGKKDPFFATVYQIVYDAQLAALHAVRPGTSMGMVDEAARGVMRAHQMEEQYLHSLGHGIGLEIHEFPRISKTGRDKDLLLEPGMVITIEPGLYFPGKGGIRYEDTIVITDTGYQNFYERAPLETL